MIFFNPTATVNRRRALRKRMTSAECLLWQKLRGRQFDNRKFRRQYGIGPYIVDFFCPSLNLAIELDGDSHESAFSAAFDQKRDVFLRSIGVGVLRFLNTDVHENFDGVLSAIRSYTR